MSEKYVAEYVEILDDHGERKGVCVTDTEHTASFEVKDEIAAMELCELLNKLFGENEELGISIKLFEDDIATKDKKIEEQQAEIERLKELERKIDRQESIINIILNNLPIHQAADIQKLVVESLKEWDS